MAGRGGMDVEAREVIIVAGILTRRAQTRRRVSDFTSQEFRVARTTLRLRQCGRCGNESQVLECIRCVIEEPAVGL